MTIMLSALLALSLSVLVLLTFSALRRKTRYPLPPGPYRWPLVGNALIFPREKEWFKFTEWAKTYGDIVYLSAFGRPIVVLNSTKAAIDLLDKRSLIYSDRPHFTMAGDLVGWAPAITLLPYNDLFRQTRKLMHQVLSPRPARDFWPLQEDQCARFLGRLLDTPENYIAHIRHLAASIILDISHGYQVSETEVDPLVKLAESTLGELSKALTSVFLVDFLPWLRYMPSILPGMGFHKLAAKWRKNLFTMLETPHQFTKTQIAQGTARPSFTSKLLEGEDCTPETEDAIKWAALAIYGGGSDTTVAFTSTFLLAVCSHPRVQVIAQEELDRVIGRNRLPLIEDRPRLPYIDAIVKEVMRWAPIGPLAVPHRVTKEDVYEGYRIPAGAWVIPNVWAMFQNPDVFPNPSEFRPERFLGPNKVEGDAADPFQLGFGFGRRACPGRHLVEPFLFLCVASILSSFRVLKVKDEQGNVIEPAIDFLPGAVSHPKPFPCRLEPRCAQTTDLIQRTIASLKPRA